MPSCFFILYTISVVSGQNEFAERTEEEESRLSKQWCEILFNAMRKLMNHKKVQVIGSLFILISMHYRFKLTVFYFFIFGEVKSLFVSHTGMFLKTELNVVFNVYQILYILVYCFKLCMN